MSQTIERQTTNWPLYWFAKLEQAVHDGDHVAAANAQTQLARLGVKVNYGRPEGEPTSPVVPQRTKGGTRG